jgi:hypothetical protein
MKRLLTIALIVAGCSGSATGPGPSAQIPPPPTVSEIPPPATVSACDADFAAAAAVDETQDSVRDLYPAVRDCESLDGWSAAFVAYAGAGIVGDPIEFLRNACRAPEITDELLCKSVPSTVDVSADIAAMANEACAETTYTGCVEGVRVMAVNSTADLLVICEYGDGLGDVVIIRSEDEAAEECAFGRTGPSRVVKILRIPR